MRLLAKGLLFYTQNFRKKVMSFLMLGCYQNFYFLMIFKEYVNMILRTVNFLLQFVKNM